jgi:hypothetical protein
MIAYDPGVIFEMIEQIDHQRALVSEADVSALVYVADVDQDRVGIFLLPAPDLRRAARQSAAICISIVVKGRQDMTVQIRCMQDRNTNRVGIERGSSTRESRDGAEQSRAACEFQKLPPTPGSLLVKHRLFQCAGILGRIAHHLNENARRSSVLTVRPFR